MIQFWELKGGRLFQMAIFTAVSRQIGLKK